MKDEYPAIQEQILHRFEKVYDAEKYGVGSILVLIGYLYFEGPQCLSKGTIGLILLELLIFILGIFVMNEFMMIYRLGTYTAFFCEGGGANSAKWVRISRRDHDLIKAIYPNSSQPKPKGNFPFGYSWGSDSVQVAWALSVLLIASWGAWYLKYEPQKYILQTVFAVLLLLGIIYVLYWLFWGVKNYRTTTEEHWRKIREAWEPIDPYENGTNTKHADDKKNVDEAV